MKADLQKIKVAINKIVQLKAELGEIGMFRTMHAMEHAVKESGWELADLLTGKQSFPSLLPKSLVSSPSRSKKRY
jgi:hypothetical protein